MKNPVTKDKKIYKYGFESSVESYRFDKGLDESIIRKISEIKKEPSWVLDLRLKAYKHWLTLEEPDWAKLNYPKIDYQNIRYYSSPKKSKLKV